MNAEWFGGRLRELREQAGLTQTQLADAAGVKRGAIARWERNDREPAWTNILALSQALGVSCEAFTQPPAEREPSGPGRPRKAGGKPGKDPGVAQGKRTPGKTAQESGEARKGKRGRK